MSNEHSKYKTNNINFKIEAMSDKTNGRQKCLLFYTASVWDALSSFFNWKTSGNLNTFKYGIKFILSFSTGIRTY